MNHGFGNLYNGPILPLYNPVFLLWVVRKIQLPLDPYLLAEITEVPGSVLSSII
jgi:hypothetical protein